MSNIVIGISSGIAAYKTEDLIKKLKKKGHDIQVIMTKNAIHLVPPEKIEELTGNKVFLHLFEKNFTPERILDSRKVDHIELAKQADLFVIAPATANTTAKLATGIADDFLTTSLLASTAAVLVCPSMNTNMWNHPATQRNLKLIQSYGYEVLAPESGSLACGTEGIGRLPGIDTIISACEEMLSRKKLLKGKKVIITAGGTAEPIDDARVITNRSSGKMGNALAEMAYRYGAEVTLVHAKGAECTHLPVEHISFSTTSELNHVLAERIKDFHVIFHAAAVSDFTTDRTEGKIDSSSGLNLELKPTPKIINKIKDWNPKITLIGFKAVSLSRHPELDSGSLQKIDKLFKYANADYIVVNDISRPDIGFESDENEVTIVSKEGTTKQIKKAPKHKIAAEIIQHIFS